MSLRNWELQNALENGKILKDPGFDWQNLKLGWRLF